MSNIISKIKTPDNSVYDIKPTSNANINTDGVFYIVSGGTSTTSSIVASLDSLTSYYEGLKVVLKYTVAQQSTTGVSLNINSLGKKSIRRNGNTILEEGLLTGGIYHLVYNGSVFIMDGYVNDANTDNVVYGNPVAGSIRPESLLATGVVADTGDQTYKAGMTIPSNSLVYAGRDGRIYPITNAGMSAGSLPLYDWGLAFLTDGKSTNDIIEDNELWQNGEITISASVGSMSSNNNDASAVPVFATFINGTYVAMSDVEVNYRTVNVLDHTVGIDTANDVSADMFIYVGAVTLVSNNNAYTGYSLKLDLSNHDFISVDPAFTTVPGQTRATIEKVTSIVKINNRAISAGGGSGGSGSYNTPVSGAGTNPPAAYSIAQNDFVCYDVNVSGLVPLKYYYDNTLSTSGIAYDWGLAICTENVVAGQVPSEGTLLQQTTLTTTNSTEKPTPIYIFFTNTGLTIPNTNIFPRLDGHAFDSSSPLATVFPDGKELTQIYIGVWKGNKFHIDLSDHDFITYGSGTETGGSPGVNGVLAGSGPYISYINGRPILAAGGGSGATLDGQRYGICDQYDQGGVDPKSGDLSGDDDDPVNPGQGPWTAIATVPSGYVPTSHSVVALYVTVSFYDNAYLNINNTGAYPVYYAGSPIANNVIPGYSVSIFMFENGVYNLISETADVSINTALFERKSNKVTSLSSNSTDTQYPSAKCVYDMLGDIESLLATI